LKTCGNCEEEGRGIRHAQLIPDLKHKEKGWAARCCWCGIETCLYPTMHEAVTIWNDCYGPDRHEINKEVVGVSEQEEEKPVAPDKGKV